jgi:hypothetical protein
MLTYADVELQVLRGDYRQRAKRPADPDEAEAGFHSDEGAAAGLLVA